MKIDREKKRIIVPSECLITQTEGVRFVDWQRLHALLQDALDSAMTPDDMLDITDESTHTYTSPCYLRDAVTGNRVCVAFPRFQLINGYSLQFPEYPVDAGEAGHNVGREDMVYGGLIWSAEQPKKKVNLKGLSQVIRSWDRAAQAVQGLSSSVAASILPTRHLATQLQVLSLTISAVEAAKKISSHTYTVHKTRTTNENDYV